MVIVLKKDIPQQEKDNLKQFLEKNHFHVNEIAGEEETIFGAVGKLGIDPREVEILPGVERVIPISKPYKMASREYKKDNTVVCVPNNQGQTIKIGGQRIVVIAGPCAVESREQMMTAAERVAAAGAVMLRGGAFKPRTSPYAFQGLGEEGVKILKEAGNAYGLPVVTEIVSADHIPLMNDYVDVYQIGARNMQNFELLKRVGELGKPVILKRGLSATIEEWLMAAEYLLSSGTEDVILCERGIRTYEKMTRNTLDLSAIPIVRSLTHLPIIVDPSHAVGIRDKVPPMGLAAVAAGADGIIVEVHCNPDKALSDGAQSLYPEQFEKLVRDIDVLAPVVGREIFRIRRTARKAPAQNTQIQENAKIICAYSGGRGAYAEQAIMHCFDGEAEELPLNSFREIFQTVSDGRADYGMVPIENSLAGSVYDNYDNLVRFEDIAIVGAVTLRIEHSLLSIPGASIDTIRNVYSHPHGFPQCAQFLSQYPQWNHIDSVSTATAAQTVAEKGSTENAAIASDIMVKYNDLIVLAQGIESNPRNYTRFVIIAAQHGDPFDCDTDPHINKASLVFTTKNEPGALYRSLGVLQQQNLNMTRLESRPIQGQPWRYMFYADVLLSEDKTVKERIDAIKTAVAALKESAEDVRLLGIYHERTAG